MRKNDAKKDRKESDASPTVGIHFGSKIDKKSIQKIIKKTITKHMEFDAKGVPNGTKIDTKTH